MKAQVFVFVPYTIPPAEIGDYVQLSLAPYRFDPNAVGSRGRYDYLVGALEKSLCDPVADGRLPQKARRALSGNICERENLPSDLIPAALVTLDGQWHDHGEFGAKWESRFRELIASQHNCWVIEVWAHS